MPAKTLPSAVEVASMKLYKMHILAKELGVVGYAKMTQAELRALLTEAVKGGGVVAMPEAEAVPEEAPVKDGKGKRRPKNGRAADNVPETDEEVRKPRYSKVSAQTIKSETSEVKAPVAVAPKVPSENGKAEKAPKAERKPAAGRDAFGCVVGGGSWSINKALGKAPLTLKQITEQASRGAVSSHLHTLIRKGYVVHSKEGYALADGVKYTSPSA